MTTFPLPTPAEIWPTSADENTAGGDENAWPQPAQLGDELQPVRAFDLEYLPASFRPIVEDVSERMQTPPDFAAASVVVALGACVGRRARITPKEQDTSWERPGNLWGAIIATPGMMKSPVQRAMTVPLSHIEDLWRAEFDAISAHFEMQRELAELARAAWKEQVKTAYKKGGPAPAAPSGILTVPLQRRLLLCDSTFEKMHEILAANPAGILVLRDELVGWLSDLDRQGREGERAFYLQAWNGDTSFTVDRIGRGSIHVPAACVSLLGSIQPARLRQYLADTVSGGAGDDGLFQRFQILVWPDTSRDWKLVDRPVNSAALAVAERVFFALSKLSPSDPVRVRFAPDAQELFFAWLAELESKIRSESGMHPAMVSHLAKYRSLMPTLAMNFMLADRAASDQAIDDDEIVGLDHAQQAARFCGYLESHAQRVYACLVSPEARAARELSRHIQIRHVPDVFRARDIYRKGWTGLDTPDRVDAALGVLEDADWIQATQISPASGAGGRPTETWIVNPRVHERSNSETADKGELQ
jgi:putative DNA primase/helicase